MEGVDDLYEHQRGPEDAGSCSQDRPGQWLAATTEGTQRGAAAHTGAHVWPPADWRLQSNHQLK